MVQLISLFFRLLIFLFFTMPFFIIKKAINIITPFLNGSMQSFPETDANGKRILTIYHEAITGVTKIHNGVNPQKIIPYLKRGENLILEADSNNKYDKLAVKVLTIDGEQIGWIPRECYATNLQEDIFYRLTDGLTVLAKVKAITGGTNSKPTYGCIIDIARYSKR